MKTILKFLVVTVLLALFSNTTLAQTCPGGKTAFVWVNGVRVPSAQGWTNTVTGIKSNFLTTHPNLYAACVEFIPVWNNSQGATLDFVQSFGQWFLQGDDAIHYLQGYHFSENSNDPDFLEIVNTVNNLRNQGYRVVLVGHSQGTFYTNEVFQSLSSYYPDVRKLSVINIASAAGYLNGGIERHVTQCGDIILVVPDSLPANIFPILSGIPPSCGVGYGIFEQINLHQLEESYLADESPAKQLIYKYLEDSLPDPGCGIDTNCYLKDSFTSGIYTNNFTKVDYGVVENGNPIITSTGGVLKMVSTPAPLSIVAHLTLNTRRYFVGDFTAYLEYNSYGTMGTNEISLVNAKDNVIAVPWTLAPIPVNPNWGSVTFTKTNTQITMYVNGVSQGSVPTTSISGYYLRFDLQGNNTLQIRNFSVVAGATPPTMTFTPATRALSVPQGNSVSTSFSLTSVNGMTGTASLQMYCMQTCPAGLSAGWPSTVTLPANGNVSIPVTLYTTTATPLNLSNYELRATLNGQTKATAITLTVTAPSVATMTLTPVTNAVSVMRGNPVTVNLTLTSQNGMTGNPTITLYCSTACPAGFSYNYTNGSSRTLPANGTLPISATFTPSTSVVPGTYNYEYWAVLNGVTKKATIAVTVTAPASTGTVVVTTTNNVSTPCTLNGTSITAPVTLTNQPIGDKSLACSAPALYTLTSVVPTAQTLSANGTINFAVNLTPTAPTTGTVTVSTTNNITTSCTLSGVSITAPTTRTNQTVGTKTLTCSAPAGYTLTSITPSATQTLVAGGTINFAVNLTPTVTTGTVVITTNGTVPSISCTLNGVALTGPGTFGGQSAGSKTLACTPPAGFTLTSITPSATQNLVAGGTIYFQTNLTAIVVTGTIVVMTNGTVPSASCTINGAPVTIPGTFTNQLAGVKTLSCTAPAGFTLTSITPSASQTLSANGTIYFTASFTSPTPVLSSLTVDTAPRINLPIHVTLYGSGFVNGMLAYVCTTSATSSCSSTPFTRDSATKVSLTNVQSSVPRTLYLRVVNSANVWSNYLTMVVTN